MKFARFEAVAIAFTIIVSAAYARQTGTTEPDVPPLVEHPVNPAVTLAMAQSAICPFSRSKTVGLVTNRTKLENCAKQD
jgi:hypothetical protein